ncbi:MAG: type I-E CRISPR-associated endoribonuclease Cas2e [Oscillospiraceae bacterium]|jgi:CRISPR-associated protein Cas2|nr:type I-E CRISPR-associated endoribonuclease Cas2e [Oscillospiraceae bacterium]
MIVVTLTDCPPSLRGDLTKWLLEINAGVFVGKVSARVRDNLWKRITKNAKSGRATMVYSAANEQGLDFKCLNSDWEPIDFDGIKLIMRPSPSRVKQLGNARRPGYSKASQHLAASRATARRAKKSRGDDSEHREYVVIDVETTGLNPDKAEIIEIGAIRAVSGTAVETFSAIVRTETAISAKIEELTGITNDAVLSEGEPLDIVLSRFINFAGNSPLVGHNVSFDMSFLDAACRKCGVEVLPNERIDTLAMSRDALSGATSHTLKALAEHFALRRLCSTEEFPIAKQRLRCIKS